MYRIGEVNLAERMVQVLQRRPDFVEIISWNDASSSNYIGHISPSAAPAYAHGYDHTAWQALLGPFVAAYKAGKNDTEDVSEEITPLAGAPVAGAFWYRPLLKDAECAQDPLGRPQGADNALDQLNIATLVAQTDPPQSVTGITVRVTSGANFTADLMTVNGLNVAAVPIGLGAQKVELVDESGKVLASGSSRQDVVVETNGTCNFNYQVVQIVPV